LKGPTKTSIPKGEKVVIEEQFELPKITLLPESLALEISWMAALQNFEKFIQDKINYLIENVKTKKSWLISSVAALVTLLAFIIISFRFYLRKKLTEKQQ